MLFKNPCDEGVILAAPTARLARRSEGWILAATVLGSSLAFIDGTVVNLALPALQHQLRATVSDVQWVIEAYALLFSSLLLVGGSLGDRFGRRRVYAIGIAVFAGASALCGLAESVPVLILARGLQGIGAALLVPGSLAILAASFPPGDRGRAIGAWSAFGAMATASGPVLGGWLIDHLSWRWGFFLNLPVALATLVLLWRFVPESRDEGASGRVDWAGAALAVAGLGGVVFALIESSRRGWGHPAVIGSLVAGAASLAAFFAVERRRPAPMLPLSVFRSRDFSGTNLLTMGLYGALSIVLFLLPLDLIQVQGYPAAAAGAALLPLVALVFLMSRWSGRLVDVLGARRLLVAGPVLAGAGFALLAVPGIGGSYWTTFFPGMLVLGIGMGVTVAPLTTTVMNAVDTARAGIASGINNAVSKTAGLIGIAVITVPFLGVFGARLDRGLEAARIRAGLAAEVRSQRTMLANLRAPGSASPEERAAIQAVVGGAFVAGFRMAAVSAAGLAIAGAATAAFMIGAPSPAARGKGGRGRPAGRAPSGSLQD